MAVLRKDEAFLDKNAQCCSVSSLVVKRGLIASNEDDEMPE